jgi:hypothetical protein
MSEEFTDAYLETALWSSTDESDESGGQPLDDNYSIDDIEPGVREKLEEEALAFLEANEDDIGDELEQAGHDFWLTRNGHGAGFWDGDWPEPAATRLTDASKVYGGVDLYVGDDGQIYASGYE